MDLTYWKKQKATEPLYPDIEWAKPEQRAKRGRLGIIGGNKLGFSGAADGYSTALSAGAGEVRVLLPDALKKAVPKSMTDIVFAPSTVSGGLSRDGLADMIALGNYCDTILLIGDSGRNSETTITYEDFLREWPGRVVITRDAIDLFRNSATAVVERPNTTLVLSFAQLQKLFQAIYFPKILSFSMQLLQLVEALHKFTSVYPVTIVVLHKDTIVVSADGRVTTTPWENPMLIWRGITAAKIATYQLWNPERLLEATTAALLE